jgi:peptidoglycan/LPS O-acetylase OafA/YrhL
MSSSIKIDPRRNSFGFLRLVFALLVIFSHAFPVGGFGTETLNLLTNNSYGLGTIAVDGFFAFSGYLITSSYLRTKSLPIFLWHRIIRIFPAYWVCILFTAIVIPLLFGLYPDFGYLPSSFFSPAIGTMQSICGLLLPLFLACSPGWEKIVSALPQFPISEFSGSLRSLISHNPYPIDINASLWTLDHEFRLYVIVGLLGFCGLLRKQVILALFLLSWVGYSILTFWLPLEGFLQAMHTSVHFWAGALVYFVALPQKRALVIFFGAMTVLTLPLSLYPLVSPLTTAYLMFWLAKELPFTTLFRKRDYSYGLYIYAYPMQQVLATAGVTQWGLGVYLVATVIITFGLAFLSWHLVESKALELKTLWQRSERGMQNV